MQHHLLPTRTTAASSLKQVLMLACASALLAACDVDDMNGNKSVADGVKEDYVILDKNKGTLTVDEPYEAYAAAFTVDENPFYIQQVEFAADGTYHITFSPEAYYDVKTRSAAEEAAIELNIDGREVKLHSNVLVPTNWREIPSTGMYTYEDGRYILMNLTWVMDGHSLLITDDYGITQRYTTTTVTPQNMDGLTSRLCHSWTLSRVLLKLYRGGNLLATYHLSDYEVRSKCIDTFVFSRYGNFYRYKNGENNGNGEWYWINRSDQKLHYNFTYLNFNTYTRLVGSNDLTVYFADNHLYISETNDAFDGNEWDENTQSYIRYKAVCLYQFNAKGFARY